MERKGADLSTVRAFVGNALAMKARGQDQHYRHMVKLLT
jgi:hypothetical protein